MDWILGESNRPAGPYLRLHLLVIDLSTIWRGVNAPTFPFNMAGLKPVVHVLYIVAVAILWYLVGRALDRQRGLIAPHTGDSRQNLFAALTLGWGAILLLIGIFEVYSYGGTSHHFALNAQLILQFLWSLILITAAATRLKRSISRKFSHGRPARAH